MFRFRPVLASSSLCLLLLLLLLSNSANKEAARLSRRGAGKRACRYCLQGIVPRRRVHRTKEHASPSQHLALLANRLVPDKANRHKEQRAAKPLWCKRRRMRVSKVARLRMPVQQTVSRECGIYLISAACVMSVY